MDRATPERVGPAQPGRRQAQGEYLVLLAAEAEVVNANWIEALLNQAQRPEVGVVGAKLVDREGSVTGAGLILGLNGEIGSAFIGEKKEAPGLHAGTAASSRITRRFPVRA